jgi:hypothetical protein
MENKPRTLRQNSALWLFFTMLADNMNESGLDMKKVLKPEIDIRWTKQSVHDYLWIPLLKIMYGKDSTTDMNTGEIDKVLDAITKHLGEKFGLTVTFPSIDELINQNLYKKEKL